VQGARRGRRIVCNLYLRLEGPIWWRGLYGAVQGARRGRRIVYILYLRLEGSTVYTAVQAARRGRRRGWRGLHGAVQGARRGRRIVCNLYLRLEGPIWSSTGSQKMEEESMNPFPEIGRGALYAAVQTARRGRRGGLRRVCILYLMLEGPICSCTGSQKGEKERVEDSMYPIPEAGGAYMELYTCTGSQKRAKERVEDSMYLIPEAGGAFMQLYRQPEGGGEGGGQYVSNT
jgi:hypothetical protein